jgi:hypothetical protein
VACSEPGCSTLVLWAERAGRRRAGGLAGGGLRFAFYGRVSTEDWQDPESSRVRQWEQAESLVRGHGSIAAEFFDVGESRSVAWGRRPQAAALVAALADPDRGVPLWVPEVGGPIDPKNEAHDLVMSVFGGMSKGERNRIKIRVKAAMGAQATDEGRFLGGRPPYGRGDPPDAFTLCYPEPEASWDFTGRTEMARRLPRLTSLCWREATGGGTGAPSPWPNPSSHPHRASHCLDCAPIPGELGYVSGAGLTGGRRRSWSWLTMPSGAWAGRVVAR